VSAFAGSKGADFVDTEFGMGVEHTEVLRRELAAKYRAEVFAPRLELWNAFNGFVKAGKPTWVNPLIVAPKKPQAIGEDAKANAYSGRLAVARWDFKHTSADQQVMTTLAVHGFQALDDSSWHNLREDFPSINVGTFVLGRNRTIRENYLADRIQAINGYTIEATVHNLEADECRDIQFTGQDGFDTFATLPELQAARRSYSSLRQDYKGIERRTRPATYDGLFTAPIEAPVELTDMFTIRHGVEGIDIAGTIQDHAYLFAQTPRARFYGELAIADGNDLFKYKGDETLAYMQAGALFDFMQGMALSGE
jgi:hypothetical protein